MKRNVSLRVTLLSFLVLFAAILAVLPRVQAPAPPEGTLLRDLSGTPPGVGVGFDGTFLYTTDFGYGTLHKWAIPPLSGPAIPVATIPITGCSASVISFDATRGVFWGAFSTQVCQITLAGVATPWFNVAGLLPGNCNNGFGCSSLIDGANFDGADNSFWYSPDGSQRVYHYSIPAVPGPTTLLGFFDVNVSPNDMAPQCGFNYNSGVATGSTFIYLSADGCSTVFKYTKTGTKVSSFVLGGMPTRNEDMECDNITFASMSTDAVWVKDAFDGHIRAFAVAQGTCTFGGGRGGLKVSKFFTDTSFNPLPKDQFGNPKVDVVIARGVVRSTNPGEIMAWVNVTNTDGSLQSLKLNETLPVDWVISPPWMPALGAIHVFYANTTSLATNPEITQPSTITVSGPSPPQTVHVAIPSFNATAIGHPLLQNQSILLEVKLDYALDGTTQSASTYPRNYTDTASATAWSGASYMGNSTSGNASGFFVAYAKVVGDVDGDGSVDITDLVLVWQHQFSNNLQYDVNGDGAVDLNDLVLTWQFQFT